MVYIFEEFAGLSLKKEDMRIALTPGVAYEFDKRSIPYSIFEDFLSADELEALYKQGHRESELVEFKKNLAISINNFYNNLYNKKLDLGFLHFRDITFLCDTIYTRSYLLRKMLEKTKCKEVSLITNKANTAEVANFDEESAFTNVWLDNSMYFLLKENHKQYDITFNIIYTNDNSIVRRTSAISKVNRFMRKIYDMASQLKRLPRIEFYNRFASATSAKEGALFYYGAEKWITDFLRNRYSAFVFLESKSRLHRFWRRIYKCIVDLEEEQPISSTKFDCQKAAREFSLLCKARVERIFTLYLDPLVNRCIPKVYRLYKSWLPILEERKIKYIVLTSAPTLKSKSLMMAAKMSEKAKSVLVSHGENIFDNPNFDYGGVPIYFSDYFFAGDAEWTSYYKDRARSLGGNTKVAVNSDFLYSSIVEKNISGKARKNKRVLYIPGFFMLHRIRIDGAEYTATWYYRFQCDLIRFFSKIKDCDFIWKGTSNLNQIGISPLQHFIEESGFKNVFVRTDSLLNNIKECDLLFTDNPATSFYQAAVNQLPVLGAYREGLKPREKALEAFGRSLVCFRELDDLKPHILEFLRSDPEKYKVRLELSDTSLYDEVVNS